MSVTMWWSNEKCSCEEWQHWVFFLNEGNAPTDEAKQSLPSDLECPQLAVFERVAVVSLPCTKGTQIISKGAGKMVSDLKGWLSCINPA